MDDEIDFAVLSELPQEIQNEIRMRYGIENFPPSPPAVEVSWECSVCTFLNHPDLEHCEICDNSKFQHAPKRSLSSQLSATTSLLSTRLSRVTTNAFQTLHRRYTGESNPNPRPSVQCRQELNVLRRELTTKCQPDTELYELLLERLWAAVFIDIPFERTGEGWLNLGFQRTNPDTDFRGGGMLALKSLVYAFEVHGDRMRLGNT